MKGNLFIYIIENSDSEGYDLHKYITPTGLSLSLRRNDFSIPSSVKEIIKNECLVDYTEIKYCISYKQTMI